MYHVDKLYSFEKEPIDKTRQFNIYSLNKHGIDQYTAFDSYFVHKYITGNKLDIIDPKRNMDLQKNSSIKDLPNARYSLNAQEINPKTIDINNNTDSNNFKSTGIHNKGNKSFNYSQNKQPYKISNRLYNQSKIDSLKLQNYDSRYKLAPKIKPKFPEKEFTYFNAPKIIRSSQYIKKNNDYTIQKEKDGSSKLIKNKSAIANYAQRLIFSVNSLNNKELTDLYDTNKFKKECDGENQKIASMLENQLRDTYCKGNNIPKMSEFKNKNLVSKDYPSTKRYMGLKYDPSNYQPQNFHKKRDYA